LDQFLLKEHIFLDQFLLKFKLYNFVLYQKGIKIMLVSTLGSGSYGLN